MIPNPNAPMVTEAEIPASTRQAIQERLAQLIAAWPATDEEGRPIPVITVHDLVVQLRRSAELAALGVTPEQITGKRVRRLLHNLNLEPDGP
ncbi:MAG: hypothetical protein M3Q03_18470 [Chloroflexota bacterium]|nr:hypothetical protein [Chloroflexota bacterium]